MVRVLIREGEDEKARLQLVDLGVRGADGPRTVTRLSHVFCNGTTASGRPCRRRTSFRYCAAHEPELRWEPSGLRYGDLYPVDIRPLRDLLEPETYALVLEASR